MLYSLSVQQIQTGSHVLHKPIEAVQETLTADRAATHNVPGTCGAASSIGQGRKPQLLCIREANLRMHTTQ
jgi:hypothetical protein